MTPIQTAGAFLGEMIGLNLHSTLDPSSPQQRSGVTELLELLTLSVLMGADFHLVMLQSLDASLRLGSAAITIMPEIVATGLTAITGSHAVGLALIAPAITIMLFVTVCFAILGKTAPQFGVVSLGLGVRSYLGFVAVFVTLPYLCSGFMTLLRRFEQLLEILTAG
jgi:flagellar biosynthetic protein FliR